jgi:hypothetical protein
MSRALYGWVLIGLVALSSGCRMCAHPFDYCGPTVTAEEAASCGENAPRSGSILSHSVAPTLADAYLTDGTVISVEDRLLGELMEPTRLDAKPAEPAVDEAMGWTSRAPGGAAAK